MNKQAVDLDVVDIQVLELAERAESATEIVKGERAAETVQPRNQFLYLQYPIRRTKLRPARSSSSLVPAEDSLNLYDFTAYPLGDGDLMQGGWFLVSLIVRG